MSVRMPAVAGTFYPADARRLAAGVEAQLAVAARQGESPGESAEPGHTQPLADGAAAPEPRLLGPAAPEPRVVGPATATSDAVPREAGGLAGGEPPSMFRAIVTPHAGHVYSGALAAVAWSRLALADAERVVLIGPSHHVWLDDAACVPTHDIWRTPLGDLPVDIPSAMRGVPGVVAHDLPHAREHSLEVQLPFLQALLGDRVLPIAPVVVSQNADIVAGLIEAALAEQGNVVAISSDLSHFLPYEEAVATDAETLAQIVSLQGVLRPEQACGSAPVSGLMAHARRHRHRLVELGRCNSGDTAGGRDRVVGYAALGMEETA